MSSRQADIASKAALISLRTSSESPGTDIGLNLCEGISAYLLGMAASPFDDHPADFGLTARSARMGDRQRLQCRGDLSISSRIRPARSAGHCYRHAARADVGHRALMERGPGSSSYSGLMFAALLGRRNR